MSIDTSPESSYGLDRDTLRASAEVVRLIGATSIRPDPTNTALWDDVHHLMYELTGKLPDGSFGSATVTLPVLGPNAEDGPVQIIDMRDWTGDEVEQKPFEAWYPRDLSFRDHPRYGGLVLARRAVAEVCAADKVHGPSVVARYIGYDVVTQDGVHPDEPLGVIVGSSLRTAGRRRKRSRDVPDDMMPDRLNPAFEHRATGHRVLNGAEVAWLKDMIRTAAEHGTVGR